MAEEHFLACKSAMTLVSGGTAANLIALKVAKEAFRQTNLVVISPCYYATKSAAEVLGYRVKEVPLIYPFSTSEKLRFRKIINKTCVLHVTLPMFGYGVWPDEIWLDSLCGLAESGSFIVTDEVNSYLVPSPLDKALDRHPKAREKFIRVRGVAKPLLLGGVRVAAIEHSENLKKMTKHFSDSFAGGLSSLDIEFMRRLTGSDASRFGQLKKNVLDELCSIHQQISDISPIRWEDGPISPLFIFGIREGSDQFRSRYQAASDLGVCFRSGATMEMFYDQPAYGRISLPLGTDILKTGLRKIKEAFSGYRVICG